MLQVLSAAYNQCEGKIGKQRLAMHGDLDSFCTQNVWYCLQLTKDDFALPKLGPKLVALAKEVTLGRGFQLLK